MNEGGEQTLLPAMPDEQRLAIAAHADLRRRSQDINVRLNTLVQSPTYTDAPLTIKPVFEADHLKVLHSMQGEPHLLTTDINELTQTITSHLEKANKSQKIIPNQAALYFAKAAALQQASGVSYEDALTQARQCLDESKEQGIPYMTPADFLPDAIIIGIERRAAEAASLPTPQEVAQAVSATPGLLKDYALVLPEEERGEFVAAFPEGMVTTLVPKSNYAVFHIQGDNLVKEMLKAWKWIWQSDLQRTYTSDFEVYSNPNGHDADLYFAIE